MAERRRYFRLREDDDVSFIEIPHSRNTRESTLDISHGGIRFLSDHFINPRSKLKIQMNFGRQKKAIHAIVIVRWIKSVYQDERYEVGAEFTEINGKDLELLKDHLRSREHPLTSGG
jgi:hypothetical protein